MHSENFSQEVIVLESEASEGQKVQEKKKREKFGRTEQPSLPTREIIHTFSQEEIEAQKLVPILNQFEESEVIDLVPAHFILTKHKRQKYKKLDENGNWTIVTAPGPVKLQEGGRYSVEMAVQTGIQKYAFHLPLERQVNLYRSHGLEVTSQVLFKQIDLAAWYLNPVMTQLIEASREERVHLADESHWNALNSKDSKRFWLWGLRNAKVVLFQVYDSRSQAVAKDFLEGLQGFLGTDGYAAYHGLASDQLIHFADWAHVRRKFRASEKNFPTESQYLLDRIRTLFLIERECKELPLDVKKGVRQLKSKPLVDQIKTFLDEQFPRTLKECSLGKGICYTLKLWEKLTVFLDHPEVLLHTNDIERSIRAPILGRKNHSGSHSLETARVASVWYSLIATCQLHQKDPRKYIECTLKNILSKKPFQMPWEFEEPCSDLVHPPPA